MKARVILPVSMLTLLSACQKAPETAATPANSVDATAPTTPGLPAPAAPAPAPAPIAALGESIDGKNEVKLEVVEASRAGGIVTIKTRMTLIGGKPGSRPIPGSSDASIYLTAADKKYMLLKDDAGKPLMSSEVWPSFERVGSVFNWWAKFPAPPAEVKAINLYFTDFTPVENVAITDR